MSLDEKTYAKLAAAELNNLLDQIDEFDPDEVEGFLSQGVLKVTFFERDVCVINSHQAAREIWMAFDARAWHFGWDGEAKAWRDTKSGEELYEVVSKTITSQLGREAVLRAAA